MRKLATVLGLALLLLPGFAAADYDVAGNIIDAPPPPPGDSPGDVCGQCPEPASPDNGLTFKNGDIYVTSGDVQNPPMAIYHLQNCQVVGTTNIQGATYPYGLGYDSTRDMWIIADPVTSRVYQLNMAGQVVNSWPSPTPRPVGAAYDPNRDLYWVCDWQLNQMNSIDPNTGMPGMVRNAPAGTRIAGLGYDAGGDVFYYHGREEAFGYVMAVQTGVLVVSFPLPVGGSNNGQGAGIAPDGNGWHSHRDSPDIWCVELAGTTPVEQVTWGSIKAIYE